MSQIFIITFLAFPGEDLARGENGRQIARYLENGFILISKIGIGLYFTKAIFH